MQSLDDVLAWLDRLAAAAPPKTSSGMSPAWCLAHCAQSIEYSITGYPTMKSAVVRALVGPIVRRVFLARGRMSHDLAGPIPGAPELSQDADFVGSLDRLRRAITDFRAHRGELAPHFVYGPVSRDDYACIHAFHVADHARLFTPGP